MPQESISELFAVAADTYCFRYQNHVSMFFVTQEGVLLVDPIGEANPEVPAAIKQSVRLLTPLPVKYVVYSHSALDHAAGGAVFADTAQFVAQERAVTPLKTASFPATPLPDITFDDEMVLELGGKRFELFAAKSSPADSYLILHQHDSKTIMYVDAFQPYSIPLRLHGSIEAMLRRLDWLQARPDFSQLITGHATPSPFIQPAHLNEQRRYLEALQAAIEHARDGGRADKSNAMLDAVRGELASEYGQWRRFDQCLATNIANAIDFASGDFSAAH